MSDPVSSTQSPQESVAYQPISGWAIAGFAVGGLFALMVTLCAIVGLTQGAPVFFPSWIIVIAIAGIVLSWIGQQHVRNSEGTRVGARLARIGLWASLISGLCYFSYYYFTGLALQKQANDFVMQLGADAGFFPRLREASAKPEELNAAYLLTLAPTARAGANPRDESAMRLLDLPQRDGSPGRFSNFKESFLPRLFYGKPGADAEIAPQAVLEWSYEQGSYKVRRTYLVKTKELELDLMLTVQSLEADSAGQARKWFVNLSESQPQLRQMKLTAFGVGLRGLRQAAKEKLDEWLSAIDDRQPMPAFQKADQTVWSRLELSGRDEAQRQRIKSALPSIKAAFAGTERGRLVNLKVMTQPDDVGRWEQIDGKIRVYFSFSLKVGLDAAGPPSMLVLGYFALDTTKAIDPATINATTPAPEWELSRFVVTQVILPPSKK